MTATPTPSVDWIASKILSYFQPETPFDHEKAQRCARVIAGKLAAARAEGEAQLAVGVSVTEHGATVVLQLKQGAHTTVLYSQGHPFGEDTLGLVRLPQGLAPTALQPVEPRHSAGAR
jgi:hypothetical protein